VMLLISIAILFRVVMILAREFTNEEEKEGINWLSILIRLMLAAFMVGAFPIVAKEVGKFGHDLVSRAGSFAGAATNTNPSNIIVTGFINNKAGREDDAPLIEYSYKDIKINTQKNTQKERLPTVSRGRPIQIWSFGLKGMF